MVMTMTSREQELSRKQRAKKKDKESKEARL